MVVIRPTYGMIALKQAVTAFAEAMAEEESIDPATARRVINRLVWGNPDGPTESSRRATYDLEELREIQSALAKDFNVPDEEGERRWHAIDSAQRHPIVKESTPGTYVPPMKTIPIQESHLAVGATDKPIHGHWEEAPSCRINHPYGEEGWRPYFGPHLNLQGNYQLHEHWIPD
jgi:hypothetical protein